MTDKKSITRQLLWQIKTGPNSWMKQSDFTATTCNLLPAQEKSWLQGAMHTASYWLKNWCSNIWYKTIAQLLLTVIYLKTAPKRIRLINYLRKRRWTLFKYSAQNWDEEGSSFSRSYHKSKILSHNMKTMSIRAHKRST